MCFSIKQIINVSQTFLHMRFILKYLTQIFPMETNNQWEVTSGGESWNNFMCMHELFPQYKECSYDMLNYANFWNNMITGDKQWMTDTYQKTRYNRYSEDIQHHTNNLVICQTPYIVSYDFQPFSKLKMISKET